MEMNNASLVALIADYLKRWNKSPNELGTEFQPNYLPDGSPTLEDVYSFYHQMKRPRETETEPELPQASKQVLPSQVLSTILSYSTATDLLSCRLVGTDWNKLALMRLRRVHKPIKFFQDDAIKAFLSVMEKRIIQQHFPFRSVEFCITAPENPSAAMIHRFNEAVGTFVTSFTVHFSGKRFRREILREVSPNFVEVRVFGGTNLELPSVLPKLRSLIILPNYPGNFTFGRWMLDFEFDKLCEWISNAIALEELHIGFPLSADPESKALRFLEGIYRLSSIGVHIHTELEDMKDELLESLIQNKPRVATLALDYSDSQEGDGIGRLISDCLQSLSTTLKTLRLKPSDQFKIEMPGLPNLETFELDLECDRPEVCFQRPLQPSHFSSLKHFILKNYTFSESEEGYYLFDDGTESVFETVESLDIFRYYDNVTGEKNYMEAWDKVFPNLKHFQIRDTQLNSEHVLRIFNYTAPHLISIRLGDVIEEFSDDCDDATMKYFTGDILTQDPKRVALENFPKLRILEMKLSNTLATRTSRQVVKFFAYWTVLRKIRKLDYLGIYGMSRKDAENGQKLFDNSSYHECVRIADSGDLHNPYYADAYTW